MLWEVTLIQINYFLLLQDYSYSIVCCDFGLSLFYMEKKMCLGVPMQIIELDGYSATCEAKGIRRKVSLFLMQHDALEIGDMVMVHVGNAIQKMSEEEARSAWELYDEMLALESQASAAMDREAKGHA